MGEKSRQAHVATRLASAALVLAVIGPLAGCGAHANLVSTTPREYLTCTSPPVGCASSSKMQAKPKTMYLSGDGSLFVKGISWHGWGSETATGRGTAEADDCNPNCAEGTFHKHPATIVLSDPKPWHRKMAYSRQMDSVPAIGWRYTFTRNLLPSAIPSSAVTIAPGPGPVSSSGSQYPWHVPPIAFIQNINDIYVRSADGKIQFVTNGEGVVWAPNHKMLLVQRVAYINPPSSEIWLVNLRGTPVRHLTRVYPDQVRFFTAGQRGTVPFVAYDTEQNGIQIINLNGTGKRTIRVRATVDYVAISKNGSEIAFTTESRPHSIPSDLYITNSDGKGGLHVVLAGTPYRRFSDPVFSPDGQWIAVTMSVTNGSTYSTGVWLVHPNGSGLHMLAKGNCPMWSDNGSWIAYINGSGNHYSLFKVGPDGKGRSTIMQFAPNAGIDCFAEDRPAW